MTSQTFLDFLDNYRITNKQINLASGFSNILRANFPLYDFCSKTFCLWSNRFRKSTNKNKKTGIFNVILLPYIEVYKNLISNFLVGVAFFSKKG